MAAADAIACHSTDNSQQILWLAMRSSRAQECGGFAEVGSGVHSGTGCVIRADATDEHTLQSPAGDGIDRRSSTGNRSGT
jgi:hypothetical protein